MKTLTSLKNCFLIAMPTLLDPHFFRTVTYICEHDKEGAIGIIINQPLTLTLGDLFEQMDIESSDHQITQRIVFSGGPVHRERGFVLHPKGETFQNTIQVSDEISLTTSPDILKSIAKKNGPEKNLVALGYAHWQPGQLEQEMAKNAWLSGPGSTDIIFYVPIEQRWKAAAALMGVDVDRLSNNIGHA